LAISTSISDYYSTDGFFPTVLAQVCFLHTCLKKKTITKYEYLIRQYEKQYVTELRHSSNRLEYDVGHNLWEGSFEYAENYTQKHHSISNILQYIQACNIICI